MMQLFELYLISAEVSQSFLLPRLILSASLSIFNHWNISDLRTKAKFSQKFCYTSAFSLKFRNAEYTNAIHEPCLLFKEKKKLLRKHVFHINRDKQILKYFQMIFHFLHKIHKFEIYITEISTYTTNKYISLNHHVWDVGPVKYLCLCQYRAQELIKIGKQ